MNPILAFLIVTAMLALMPTRAELPATSGSPEKAAPASPDYAPDGLLGYTIRIVPVLPARVKELYLTMNEELGNVNRSYVNDEVFDEPQELHFTQPDRLEYKKYGHGDTCILAYNETACYYYMKLQKNVSLIVVEKDREASDAPSFYKERYLLIFDNEHEASVILLEEEALSGCDFIRASYFRATLSR